MIAFEEAIVSRRDKPTRRVPNAEMAAGVLMSLCTTLALACAKDEGRSKEGAAASAPPPLRGPQVVQDMVAAHGGMEAWRSAPTVSFEDDFGVPGQPAQVSRVVVETSRRRVYIDMPGGASLAWDGTKSWSMGWQSPLPPRFLALLNFYFLNLPWLSQDPGVKLGEPGTGSLPNDATEYVTVMMTFAPGTGDTPDDYYRLYIDPATKRLKACGYVVTYQALLPPGVPSTPEHTLVYDEMVEVGGLLVPARYTIYENTAVYATCSVRNWAFDKPFDESRMTMPAGAVLDNSVP